MPEDYTKALGDINEANILVEGRTLGWAQLITTLYICSAFLRESHIFFVVDITFFKRRKCEYNEGIVNKC